MRPLEAVERQLTAVLCRRAGDRLRRWRFRVSAEDPGPAQQEALNLVAALPFQDLELAFGLDALGQDRDRQAPSERQYCADDGHRLRAAVQFGDEQPVQL